MSGPFGSSQWAYASGEAFTIDQSLKFNNDDTATLNRTPASAGNRRTFTTSVWFKLSQVTSSVRLFTVQDGSGTPFYTIDIFQDGDTDNRGIRVNSAVSGDELMLITNGRLRDSSAWYHLVAAVDTTQGTSSNRCKIYLNGVQLTDFATETYPSQNYDTPCNNTIKHNVGAKGDGGNPFDGYMAEFNHIDGQQLTPSSFGETGDYGEWKPIEYSGSYGTNGFYLPFKQDYSVEGFSAVTYKGTNANQYIGGVGFKPDLVWMKRRDASAGHMLVDSVRGVTKSLGSQSTGQENTSDGGDDLTAFNTDGFSLGPVHQSNSSNVSGGSIVAWNWDMGANTPTGFGCVTYKGSNVVNQSVNGMGFSPDLVWIKSRTGGDSHHWFDKVRGATKRIRSDVTATGDTVTSFTSFDSDGFTLGTTGSGITYNAHEYVAYGFNMGGTSVANTTGDINTTVMANPTYGQSIVSWTGTGSGSSPTVGHGLSSAPEFVIVKHTDATGVWAAQHKYDTTKYFQMQDVDAAGDGQYVFDNVAPTNSVFTINATNAVTNLNGGDYIAYCFHSVAGYSSIGNYNGDGSTNGSNAVNCGFRPAFVMIKCINDLENWWIWDNQRNPFPNTQNRFAADTNGAETTNIATGADNIQFTSTGFKMTGLGGGSNQNGNSYIYIAFAGGKDSSSTFNTTGSIDSRVKASTTYGQSIVKYIGSGSTGTVGHGLTTAPNMTMVKCTSEDGGDWKVQHTGLSDGNKVLYLNSTATEQDESDKFGAFAGATTFPLNGSHASVNGSGKSYIAYCFHDVAGYSKFGTYEGDGSSSRTIGFGAGGFKPAFVMIKNVDYAYRWYMFDSTRDPSNPAYHRLFAEQSGAEATNSEVLELSANSDNGFKIITSDSEVNRNGDTFIYMAFADKREYAYWLDQSGNNNDWTSNNLTESDISVDSPTNNFCTMNPLDKANIGAIVYTEGNLVVDPTPTEGGNPIKIFNNMYVSSGKWYWEVTTLNFGTSFTTSAHSSMLMGVTNDYNYHATETNNSIGYRSGDYAILFSDGNKYNNNANSSYGSAIEKLNIFQIALDLDNNKIWFGNNGTWFASGDPAAGSNPAYSSLPAGDYSFMINDWNRTSHAGKFAVNFGQDSSFAGNKTAQGNQDSNDIGDFYYTPPTGFLALCTSNLPEPAVTPSEHFNTVLWTGNGSTQSIPNGSTSPTSIAFQPDFTWIKSRSIVDSHHLFDSVRGAGYRLRSDNSEAENYSGTAYLTAFNSDGFALGGDDGVNKNTATYAAWNWKANGSGSSNTTGSINTTATSANVDAGFSIVAYEATGSAGTVGHGLSKAPEMIIVKHRDQAGTSWTTYYGDNTDYLRLNSTVATIDAVEAWNDTSPSATLFSVGANGGDSNNTSGGSTIAYCFHSVDGYSKVGSYTGNGNADGTFVYTGFRPAFVMIKRTDSANSWHIIDTQRDTDNIAQYPLLADTSGAESSYAGSYYDVLSNGFKMRNTYADHNADGGTYIYLAFAETPFKYSNAR